MLLRTNTCAIRWLWTIHGHRKGRLQWPKIRGTTVAGFSFHITMETWQRSECDWLQVDDGATTMQETVPIMSCQLSITSCHLSMSLTNSLLQADLLSVSGARSNTPVGISCHYSKSIATGVPLSPCFCSYFPPVFLLTFHYHGNIVLVFLYVE